MKKIISFLLTAACAASLTLSPTVTASAEEAYIVNGDFSDGLNGWSVTSEADGASAANGVLEISASCTVSQTVRLGNGIYDLSAELTNSDAGQNAYLYIKAGGSVVAKTALPQYFSPASVAIRGVTLKDGTAEIGVSAEGGVTVDNVTLTPAASEGTEFLKGGEISKLTYIEDMGGKFRDADGNERDALQILAENGFNLARIRVLNNPGKGRGDGYYYLPEGYQTEEDCLELARRAKNKGMKIQFSFAYSDYWSDGGQQYIPSEWQQYLTENNITDKQEMADYLSERVYEFTKKVMNDLIAQDTTPEYVSIGNEMQYGILFGHWQNNNGLYNTSGAKYQVQILNAGARAVRETSPSSKIILHTDNGGKVISGRTLFYNTFLSQVDCDIIGVSYYPYYNKDVSIDTVVNEFNTMIKKYDKDVIIMETGYNWSELRGDGYEGQLENSGYYQNIYGETEEGQHAFFTELYSKLRTNVTDGRCIGDLYWDPVMIYDGGSYKIGWAVKESDDWADGNVVSNSTLFDFGGKALKAQEAMKYNTDARSNLLISGKIRDDEGNPAANTDVKFTVGSDVYTVTTDAYGEYILSVPYADEINITAEGYEDSYCFDAPKYDVLIKGANFPDIPEFSYSKSDKKVTLPEISEEGAAVITAFYKDGALTRAERTDVNRGDKEFYVSPADGETVRAFLWNSLGGMEPLSAEAVIVE